MADLTAGDYAGIAFDSMIYDRSQSWYSLTNIGNYAFGAVAVGAGFFSFGAGTAGLYAARAAWAGRGVIKGVQAARALRAADRAVDATRAVRAADRASDAARLTTAAAARTPIRSALARAAKRTAIKGAVVTGAGVGLYYKGLDLADWTADQTLVTRELRDAFRKIGKAHGMEWMEKWGGAMALGLTAGIGTAIATGNWEMAAFGIVVAAGMWAYAQYAEGRQKAQEAGITDPAKLRQAGLDNLSNEFSRVSKSIMDDGAAIGKWLGLTGPAAPAPAPI